MYHQENCTVDINSNRDYFHQLGYVFSQITFAYFDAEISVICSNSEHDLSLHTITCLLCQPRIVRHMVTALLVFWDLVCGTICQKRSGVVVVCHLSRVHLKHIFSNSRLGFNIISSKYFSRNSELCSVRMYIG